MRTDLAYIAAALPPNRRSATADAIRLRVRERRIPVASPTRREVEDVPERPHQIDVAVVLAFRGLEQVELAAEWCTPVATRFTKTWMIEFWSPAAPSFR